MYQLGRPVEPTLSGDGPDFIQRCDRSSGTMAQGGRLFSDPAASGGLGRCADASLGAIADVSKPQLFTLTGIGEFPGLWRDPVIGAWRSQLEVLMCGICGQYNFGE